MPPKITINGKEIDMANLPPEFKNLAAMSPELKELMADKDGNGVPDIADNPFTMLAKLGQLSSIAKDMPVLMSSIKTPAEQKEIAGFAAEEVRQIAGSGVQKPSSSGSPSSMAALSRAAARQNLSAQYRSSTSSPIKHDTGRRVLFILVMVGIVGWYLYQSMIK